VNNYVKLKKEQKDYNDEIDEKLEKLKEALITFCKKKGVEIVVGSNNKVSVKETTSLKFPGKNTEEREQLIKLLKKIKRWDEVTDLDIYALKDVVKNNIWSDEQLKKLKKFEEVSTVYRLSVRKRS
jgi:hypothetical protein